MSWFSIEGKSLVRKIALRPRIHDNTLWEEKVTMKMKTLAGVSLAAALLAVAAPALTRSPASAPRYGVLGVDLTGIDKSVKPGDDFWTYMNGGWNARTEIAADRASAGYG